MEQAGLEYNPRWVKYGNYSAASGSSDNVGVARIEFYQRSGTTTLPIDELRQAPYTLFKQESCTRTGQYSAVYSARAFDAAGNASPYSNEVTVSYTCGK